MQTTIFDLSSLKKYSAVSFGITCFILNACQPPMTSMTRNVSIETKGQTNQIQINQANQNLTVNYENLMGYKWSLISAENNKGEPIAEFNNLSDKQKKQIRLTFQKRDEAQALYGDKPHFMLYSIGCNTMGKGFKLQGNTLATDTAGGGTTMGCDKVERKMEHKMSELLGEDSQLSISSSPQVTLTFITQNNNKLVWAGEATARTKYGVEPTLFRLQVAPQMVGCENDSSKSCLLVREVHYEEYTGKQIIDSQWHMIISSIEGYQHENALSTIVVERYRPTSEKVIHDVWVATESVDYMIKSNTQIPK